MTTFTGQVSQSSDDAASLGQAGTPSITVTTVNTANKASANFEITGSRFQNVTIPNGATISSAIFSFNFVNSTNTGTAKMDCEAHDNASTYTTVTGNLGSTARPLTGNTVTLTGSAITSTGFQAMPDIVTPVAAVLNRAGWASGNALSCMLTGQGPSGSSIIVNQWDQSPADGAEISITYSSGGVVQNLLMGVP